MGIVEKNKKEKNNLSCTFIALNFVFNLSATMKRVLIVVMWCKKYYYIVTADRSQKNSIFINIFFRLTTIFDIGIYLVVVVYHFIHIYVKCFGVSKNILIE